MLKIESFLEKESLSQRELAKMLGRSKQLISWRKSAGWTLKREGDFIVWNNPKEDLPTYEKILNGVEE